MIDSRVRIVSLVMAILACSQPRTNVAIKPGAAAAAGMSSGPSDVLVSYGLHANLLSSYGHFRPNRSTSLPTTVVLSEM